ncbi:hypothetical protein [Couchioplanes azureus]|uniref:hypothetical protein n=1 Tax=Couchioplanes caeruleus TaxID=56438 RepID=UPI00166FE750|nr:hypothetical protein [Couchioplanes caeruleus]
MGDTQNIRRGHLAVAALVAGAAGLGLLTVGWWVAGWEPRDDWERLTDLSWWTSGLLRAASFLAFTKAGFKAALLVVLGGAAAFTWLRARRRRQSDAADHLGQRGHLDRPATAGEPAATSSDDPTGPAGSG